MTQQVSRNKQDTSVFQMSMAALDREKDALQDEVDQMTEKVVALEEELSKKVADNITGLFQICAACSLGQMLMEHHALAAKEP